MKKMNNKFLIFFYLLILYFFVQNTANIKIIIFFKYKQDKKNMIDLQIDE